MADEWSAPPAPQDYAGPAQDGVKRLLRRIDQMQRELNDLRSSTLRTAGLSVSESGLTIDSELLVTGATRIEGTLSLPAGIIDNDALANPVQDGAIGASETGFTIPTSMGAVISRTIDIPEGFTKAAVLGVVSVGAWNPTATGDYMYAEARIRNGSGASLPVYVGPSAYGVVTVSAIRTITDLTGPTLSVEARCYAAGGWGSNGSNIANIDVIALFRR